MLRKLPKSKILVIIVSIIGNFFSVVEYVGKRGGAMFTNCAIKEGKAVDSAVRENPIAGAENGDEGEEGEGEGEARNG